MQSILHRICLQAVGEGPFESEKKNVQERIFVKVISEGEKEIRDKLVVYDVWRRQIGNDRLQIGQQNLALVRIGRRVGNGVATAVGKDNVVGVVGNGKVERMAEERRIEKLQRRKGS